MHYSSFLPLYWCDKRKKKSTLLGKVRGVNRGVSCGVGGCAEHAGVVSQGYEYSRANRGASNAGPIKENERSASP